MFSALKSLYSKPLPLAEAKAELIKLTRNYDHKGITALCKYVFLKICKKLN